MRTFALNQESRTCGAEALIRRRPCVARLNPCPSLSDFFRKLFGRAVKSLRENRSSDYQGRINKGFYRLRKTYVLCQGPTPRLRKNTWLVTGQA